MLKKVALVVLALAALAFFATRTPEGPPGFVSLRASPTFQAPALLEKVEKICAPLPKSVQAT